MSQQPKTFVLVHGAFYGGWVWQKVTKRLLAKGYLVTSPTLTGVGERAHLATSATDLSTHIQDLVAHFEMEDLTGVTLVGWSYGGMVVKGSLDRIADRVASVIYLDAFVPEDGWSVYDYNTSEAKARIDSHRVGDSPITPYSLDFFDVTNESDREWITERQTPQPWRTMFEAAKAPRRALPDFESYVRCTRFSSAPFDEAQKRMPKNGVHVVNLEADHLCMVTAAELTTELLVALSHNELSDLDLALDEAQQDVAGISGFLRLLS